MTKESKKIFADIRALKVQGAEAVAEKSVDALAKQTLSSKARDRKSFLKELRQTAAFLKTSRPTEPALRNALRFVLLQALKSDCRDVGELKLLVEEEALRYKQSALAAKLKIAEYGARLIPKNSAVLVHCHSSTVMRVLKKAFDEKKRPRVFCTESRPLYQGRLSAKELSDYGLDVALLVDSAAFQTVRESDLVLVGADAITAEGDLVNKIGSAQIALAAREFGKKFFSCTGTHKFDPLTLWGEGERMERRAPSEVLGEKEAKRFGLRPRKIRVLNPAFDLVKAEHVTAYVTELGVIPPQSLLATVWKEFDLDKQFEQDVRDAKKILEDAASGKEKL